MAATTTIGMTNAGLVYARSELEAAISSASGWTSSGDCRRQCFRVMSIGSGGGSTSERNETCRGADGSEPFSSAPPSQGVTYTGGLGMSGADQNRESAALRTAQLFHSSRRRGQVTRLLCGACPWVERQRGPEGLERPAAVSGSCCSAEGSGPVNGTVHGSLCARVAPRR